MTKRSKRVYNMQYMKIFRLTPSIKDSLWGGDRLLQYGKRADFPRLAESYELSFDEAYPSFVEDGRRLRDVVGREEIGVLREDGSFPLLIKLIDAKEDLSVQVHPTDAYARACGLGSGKSELWYVLDADEGSGLYLGFRRDLTRQEWEQAIETQNILPYLQFFPVKKGEAYYVPAGTVHAIGKGVTVYEIQQNCDITFRVYDYDRVDADGKKRDLHVAQAKQVCELVPYTHKCRCEDKAGIVGIFVGNDFTLERGEGKTSLAPRPSFCAITVTDGSVTANGVKASKGDTLFVCAGERVDVEGDGEYLIGGMRYDG